MTCRLDSRVLAAAIALSVLSAATGSGFAQALPAASDTTSTIRFLVVAPDSNQPPRQVDAAQLPALRREILLDLHDATREHALAEIGRLSGMSLVYASDAVARGATVTLAHRAISIGAALETVLAGAGVDVLMGEHGTVVLLARAPAAPGRLSRVDGVVVDSVSGRPVRLAAVRLTASGRTVLTDNAGRFHLETAPGALALDVRRIGFRPASLELRALSGSTAATVVLAPNVVGLDAMMVGAASGNAPWDSTSAVARALVAAAIDRQQRQQVGIQNYRYDAHVVLVDRAGNKPADSGSVIVTRESVLTGYWEAAGGGRDQQTIIARRRIDPLRGTRAANVRVDWEPLQVERFDGNRWTLFTPSRLTLVSPIGADALGFYTYAVLDTVIIDGHRAFRVAVKPASSHRMGFDGTIDIADSTFEVLAVDVGVDHTREPLLDYADPQLGFHVSSDRIGLRYADAGGGHRMLASITMTLNAALLGIIPMQHDYAAFLGHYQFNQGGPPPGMGSFPLVIAAGADHAASAVFAAAPPVAAVGQEARVLAADSTPAPHSHSMSIGIGTLADITFNRVDGWGWGFGERWVRPAIAPWMSPTVKFGYAFGTHHPWSRVEDQIVLSPLHRLSVDARYHNEIATVPTFGLSDYNPTFAAIVAGAGADQLDRYRERGFSGTISTKLIGPVQLSMGYANLHQTSTPLLARYAGSSGGWLGLIPPPNPSIADGELRSVSATIGYDSRPLVLAPHSFERLDETSGEDRDVSFTKVDAQIERAAPSTLGGDFDYRRYTVRLERRQESWERASTDIVVLAGWSTGQLPPQRYFDVNGGAPVPSNDAPFAAVGSTILGGDRAAAVIVTHTLSPAFLAESHIPLVRSLPLQFAVRAAAFWSTFRDNDVVGAADRGIASTARGFREVGLSVTYTFPNLPVGFTLRADRELARQPVRGLRLTVGF